MIRGRKMLIRIGSIVLLMVTIGIFACLIAPPKAEAGSRYELRPYFAGRGYAYAYPLLTYRERPVFGITKHYEFKRRPLSVPQRPHRTYSSSPTRVFHYHHYPRNYSSSYPYRGSQVIGPDRPSVIEREKVIIERQTPPQNYSQQQAPNAVQQRPPLSRNYADEGEDKSFVEHLQDANRLFKDRDYNSAVLEFRKAAAMQPSNAPVKMGYALALLATGDYVTAASELRHALKSNNEWYDEAPELSTYYGDLNDFKAHFAMLERYIQKHPKNLDAQFLSGYLNFVQGKLDRAADTMAEILEKDPNELEATTLLGRLASKQLEYE